jgi:SAM-dependent methyltransferase
MSTSDSIVSPFGGTPLLVQELSTQLLIEKYTLKCQIDVSRSFGEISKVQLYRCEKTGYKFWRPQIIAGDEEFYKTVSAAWPEYYRTERWEHPFAKKYLIGKKTILEIGCGPGHFLKTLEGRVTEALGIEPNQNAVRNKVTQLPVCSMSLTEVAKNFGQFEAIYAFQVLEHVVDPCELIFEALRCLKVGGLLIFSTPNNNHRPFLDFDDAFDLPPHHVGHFNPDVYRKIARLFGLKVLDLRVERRKASLEKVTAHTENSFFYRGAKFATRQILNLGYLMTKEPGPNMIVVFQKETGDLLNPARLN